MAEVECQVWNEPNELREMLEAWRDGRRSTRGVHEWAEAQVLGSVRQGSWTVPAAGASGSFPAEVLLRISLLNQELLTSEDVPTLLALLAEAREREADAWVKWEVFRRGLWEGSRAESLRGDPYYAID